MRAQSRYYLATIVLLLTTVSVGISAASAASGANAAGEPGFVFVDVNTAVETTGSTPSAPGVYASSNGRQTFVNDSGSTSQPAVSQGFIVELSDEPILKKIKKEKYKGNSVSRTKISAFRTNLRSDKQQIKDKIKEKLGKKGIFNQTGRGKAANKDDLVITGDFESTFNGFALDINTTEAKMIAGIPGVKAVHRNEEVKTTLMDSVPLIKADYSWALGYDGEGITIAIIDTGIDYTHGDLGACTSAEFLAGTCQKVLGGYDFINLDDDPMDDQGHGTHCAGIAAGDGALLTGVAPGAKLYAYKVLSSSGSGTFTQVIGGIERAVDPNQDGDYSDRVDVMSLSLGGPGNPDDPVSSAIDNASDAGVVPVVAAGNSGPAASSIGSPGTARKALTVGAVFKKDYIGTYWGDVDPLAKQVTPFSSRGPVTWDGGILSKPDILAPGAIICAAQWDLAWDDRKCSGLSSDEHVGISGTSMATPHIAGVAALLLQKNPDWTPLEIKSLIKNTAEDLGYDRETQGAGFVNVADAIAVTEKPLISFIDTSGTFGGASVDIIGTAKGENLTGWTLSYKVSGSADSHTTICSGNQTVDNGLFCSWNIGLVSDQFYELKLAVNSATGSSESFSYIRVENTRIHSPIDMVEDVAGWWESGYYLATWKDTEVTGVSAGVNFNYYTLELCYEGSCSSALITLANGGTSPVETEGALGTLHTTGVTQSGTYSLRLTTYYSGGKDPSVDENRFYVSTDMQVGWPRTSELLTSGSFAYSMLDQPNIADIDKNGNPDIILTYGRDIQVIDHAGNPVPGWPFRIETMSGETYTQMQYAGAVGDVDGDGEFEIAVGDNYGFTHVLNHDATYVFPPRQMGGYQLSPVIADIDGNGIADILIGNFWGGVVRAIDGNGNTLAGWDPKYPPDIPDYPYDKRMSSLGPVGDMDGDGDVEVFYLTSACNTTGYCEPEFTASQIVALDHLGNALPGWPVTSGGSRNSSVIAADIDGDGDKEILVGSADGNIYAWNIDGSVVAGWPSNGGELYGYSNVLQLSAGDLDGDGDLEISAAMEKPDPEYGQPGNINQSGVFACTMSYNHDGTRNSETCEDPNWYDFFISRSAGHVTIADTDGDYDREMTPAFDSGYLVNHIFNIYTINPDGSVPEGFPKAVDAIQFTSVSPVADLDSDGDNEMVIQTWSGVMYVFDLPGYPLDGEWPLFAHDARHSNCYGCDEDPVDPDTTPPTPDPMGWALVPALTGDDGITMTASTATDDSGNPVQYYFACTAGGSGCTVSGWQMSNVYQISGTDAATLYSFQVKARDMSGNETAYSAVASVTTNEAPNQPPAASFTSSSVDLTATFTDTSTDADGSVVSWLWDLGDGSTSTAQNPVHTYAEAGSYQVALTARDDDDAEDSATQWITVTAPPVTLPPAAPTNLAAVVSKSGRGKDKVITAITLNWTDNSDNEDGFVVEGCTRVVTGKGKTRAVICDYEAVGNVGADTTSFDVDLSHEHDHFRVKAVNSYGESAWSNEVKI